MRASGRRAPGFTLIEVLVTLALLSLIGTILIESLRVGGRSWQQVTRKAANMDEVARAQNFLRERLATLYPASASRADSQPEPFVGEREAMEFSSLSTARSAQGLVRYWLGLSQSEPANLEIRYRPGSQEPPGSMPSAWSREPLLKGVAGLSIQFWEGSAGQTGRWADHWEDSRNLPQLIRIDVRFAKQDARRWPPLYIEPRIDTRASCVFDVVSRRCRDAI